MKVTNTDITKTVQNFGKIKNVYHDMLAEGIASKNDKSKELFKTYIKSIKESEILKTQYLVYNNIENKIETNEFKATQFVQENIELLKKFAKKDILDANLKLAEGVLFEQESSNPHEQLHEDISTLIFTDKTATTIDTILEAQSRIVEYIRNNKAKDIQEAIFLPNSMISTIMVDKYNEKYNSLDESEKAVLKSLIDSNDEQKKEVYGNVLKECIELVNTLLGSDKHRDNKETFEKLLKVKERLLNDKNDINEDYFKNVSKLVELRSSLKNQ